MRRPGGSPTVAFAEEPRRVGPPPVPPGLWVGQAFRFGALAVLLVATAAAWHAIGAPHPAAFWTAVGVPVVHELFVWLAWRLQLRDQAVTRTLGFPAYLAVFFALLAARPLALLVLAWLDRESFGLEAPARWIATGVLLVPAAYAMDSVVRYFGPVRAAGADHFDPGYRSMPLERRGIFRFTANGMYAYGFLGFWAIALGFDSRAALLAAAFSHASIWSHYAATERPDLGYLHPPRS